LLYITFRYVRMDFFPMRQLVLASDALLVRVASMEPYTPHLLTVMLVITVSPANLFVPDVQLVIRN